MNHVRARRLVAHAALPMLALAILLLSLVRFTLPDVIQEFLHVVPISEESNVVASFVSTQLSPGMRLLIRLPVYLMLVGLRSCQ